MSTNFHSILGLPRSGKTTFLAALWHLIDAGEVSTKLVLDKLVGNHEYLNTIADAWRRCEEVPRTSMAAEVSVAIHIHEPVKNTKSVLGFPDLSGESFEAQFATRTCDVDYVEGYQQAGGILLFVNADRATDGVTIVDLVEIDPDVNEEGNQAEVPWEARMVPEQARLVDLLQFLQTAPFARRRRKIAVVISAWDVVAQPEPSPNEWLGREMPLLAQYLEHNPDSFHYRVYGVSAQGGAVSGEVREKLLDEIPSRRVRCVGYDADPHDLTAPISWLNEQD